MFVREMTEQECIALVASGRLGRLACCREGRPYVVPIHYALAGRCLYGFSMLGQKVEWMRDNPCVCVEIDELVSYNEWKSVVISGRYMELPDTDQWRHERLHAWSLLEKHVNWWEPGGLKPGTQPIADASPHVFYSIDIEEVTGRAAMAGEPM
ncbi:pyridoxamine 5'-phosphate oxidase family protein [Ensifer sp. IC4062]|nr:pyridoxamine 5'-phosphate oxidase family protein [Ensifer sp. IC4062]MCA1444552.1 pyridoxamine 5'-phosphate oxidase family protein [Ensifer sp. IC4062]